MWKCLSTYNSQGKGVVERKKALQNVTRNKSKEWGVTLENVLFRYRRRAVSNGIALFEILFAVKPMFAMEPSEHVPEEEVLARARPFELAMALISRAERLVPRSVPLPNRWNGTVEAC